jgi:cytidyltransferase-like protein
MKTVWVSGSFDGLDSRDVRFLEEAAKIGCVVVGLWTDDLVLAAGKSAPKFPFEERLYLLQAIRYVARVVPVGDFPPSDSLEKNREFKPDLWVADERSDSSAISPWCATRGLDCRSLKSTVGRDFPPLPPLISGNQFSRPRVVVTGCFDWFHSGHVRFFEEASIFGDLYVGVGSDANLRTLKGQGHPLFPQDERAYMVQAVRHVKQAFIPTGGGWMDAEPEIAVIRPSYYVVNEDGDRPEKREFCRQARIGYIVLSRLPRPGLPPRDGTTLRGF